MTTINTVGIIGGGKMGTNLFYYFLDFGFNIRWFRSPSADLEKARRTFNKRINRSRETGIIPEGTFEKLKAGTSISQDKKILTDCDLVIETIPEDINLKRELFKTLDDVLNDRCIIASNSSSINPGALVPAPRRIPLFLGVHFFYPVSLKNVVEVIIPGSFQPHARDAVINFLQKIRRNYIILDEENSFILNKIFLDFQNEAFNLVHNGHITFSQLDKIVKEHFFPVGVFEFFDCVGIDTMLASIRNYIKPYPHKDYYYPLVGHLESMVKQGFLGQKCSRGFYQYSRGEIISINDDSSSLSKPMAEFVEHLRFTYLTTVRRFTVHSGLSIQEMNDAVKEYFSIEKGPFEI